MNKAFADNCTLLVNTCDAYSDCWDGFFKLLHIQWQDMPLKVVLNTETKNYDSPYFDITVHNTDKRFAWGKRLISALKSIDTKYVIFALEDFYLESPVDEKKVIECYGYMENDPEIACFCFYPTDDENNIQSNKYPGFEKRPQNGDYRLNCQFAIWNREKLISYIRPHENPWEWELYGSKRSSRYNTKFYSIMKSAPAIFDYQNGGALRRGRWWKTMLDPLCEKYGIEIDYSSRDTFEELQSNPQPRKRNLWRGIKNRINKIRSLI